MNTHITSLLDWAEKFDIDLDHASISFKKWYDWENEKDTYQLRVTFSQEDETRDNLRAVKRGVRGFTSAKPGEGDLHKTHAVSETTTVKFTWRGGLVCEKITEPKFRCRPASFKGEELLDEEALNAEA